MRCMKIYETLRYKRIFQSRPEVSIYKKNLSSGGFSCPIKLQGEIERKGKDKQILGFSQRAKNPAKHEGNS